MQIIQSFDPAAIPSGIMKTNGVNKNEQLVLYNSSLSCLQLTFKDKTSDMLPPGWAKSWKKDDPFDIVTYSTVFTLPIIGDPVSLLYGTVYEFGEHISDVNTQMQYIVTIGNASTLVVNTAENLINTGLFSYLSDTPIVLRATESPSTNVLVGLNGDTTIYGYLCGSTQFRIIDTPASGSPNIYISDSSRGAQVNGQLYCQGNFSILNGDHIYMTGSGIHLVVNGNELMGDSGGNLFINSMGGKLYFKVGNTNVGSIDNFGNLTVSGNVTAHGTP